MDREVTDLIRRADEECQSFLGRFDENSQQTQYEHELMPIFDCMVQITRAVIGKARSPAGTDLIEIAHAPIVRQGEPALARVMLDPFKKLQLVITELCPVHGDKCQGGKALPPRNVTLKELQSIGFSGVFIVKCLHDFLHGALVDSMISMKGPSEVC